MDRHISALEDPDDDEPVQAPLPFDTGDAAQVKARIKSVKLTEVRRTEVLRTFLASPDGRAWFYGFLAGCGCFQNPFSSDPEMMAFSCGEMNVGQKVLAEIMKASPEAYLRMLKESEDDSRSSSG